MSVSVILTPVARWRASAVSDSSQGADGVAWLARSAYDALCLAPWEHDYDPAMMPVHEYDREEPRGQAYKAVYGYDKAARTERSCAGAACLTYRIPDDAMDDTNEDGLAMIESLAVSIATDRYCDQGALVFAEVSPSEFPSRFGVVHPLAADGVRWLATGLQRDADGNPLAPNKREGRDGTASLSYATPKTPAAYLHLHLMLADYLGVRDAWIEGGAMFADETATVTFSRAVESGGGATRSLTRLTLGRVAFDASVTPAAALAKYPRLSCWMNWTMSPDATHFGALASSDWAAKAENLLAFLFNSPALYDSQSSTVAYSTSVELAATGRGQVSDLPVIRFCAHVAHGMTAGRAFRGMVFSAPLNPASGVSSIPYRLIAYGISGLPCFSGGSPNVATPLPWWGDVLSESFRRGEATSLRCMSAPSSASGFAMSAAANGVDATTEVPATPLAALDVTGEVAEVRFRKAWRPGELATVVLALIPNGVPSASSFATLIGATVSRSVRAVLPDAGGTAVALGAVTSATAWTALGGKTLHSNTFYSVYRGLGLSVTRYTRSNGKIEYLFNDFSSKSYRAQTTIELTFRNVTINVNGKSYTFQLPWVYQPYVTWHARRTNPSTVWAISQNEYGETNSWTECCEFYGEIEQSSFTATGTAEDGSEIEISGVIYASNFSTNYNLLPSGPYSSMRAVDLFKRSKYYEVTIYDNYNDYNGSAEWRSGTAYTWADSNSGTVQAPLRITGTASFELDGETYTADLGEIVTDPVAIAISGKGATDIPSGVDTTRTATAAMTIPAYSGRHVFQNAAGIPVSALLELPAQAADSSESAWGGPLSVDAKSVANGLQQKLAERAGADTGMTVAFSETSADQEIDLGEISLYE